MKKILGTLLTIIAINAFGGGCYGMMGAKDIPLEWLSGSPFRSYFWPSFFLFFVIGGGCLLGSIAVFKNSLYAKAISFICSGLLIGWITIQMIIIGFVSWMQPAILISGFIVLILSFFYKRNK